MGISIINWNKEIFFTQIHQKTGLDLAILTESNGMVTYLSVIPPYSSIKPHYHKKAGQHCHVVSGSCIVRLSPIKKLVGNFQMVCKYAQTGTSFVIPKNVIHELINNSDEKLTLLVNCPISQLKKDTFPV